MKISRAAIEQARANLRLQQANAKIDPDTQFGYKRTAGFNTLYAAVQIPLPVRNRNQGQIEAAVAEIRVAESSLASMAALVRSELEDRRQRLRIPAEAFDRNASPHARPGGRGVQNCRCCLSRGRLRHPAASRCRTNQDRNAAGLYPGDFSNFSRARLLWRPRKETCHENNFDLCRLHCSLRLRAEECASALRGSTKGPRRTRTPARSPLTRRRSRKPISSSPLSRRRRSPRA